MGFLFSWIRKPEEEKQEKSRILNVDMIQLDIKKQMRTINEQRVNTETRAKALEEEAIEQRDKGNKSRAILALKMKKLMMSKSEKLNGVLIKLEETLQDLQEAIINKEVQDILNKGNAAIKDLQKSVSIEDFQKIADDLNEQQQVNDELAKMLGVNTVDEKIFEDELNELAEKEDKKKAEEIAAQLSNVPTESLPVAIKSKTFKKEPEQKVPEQKEAVLA